MSVKAEEAAMLYVKYIGSDYILNKTFNKNFFHDWKRLLGKDSPIKVLENCDFTEYKDIYENLKAIKKAKGLTDSDSEPVVNETKYKTAMVDGQAQQVGNYRMEPPGIFLGRGDNPKIGLIKDRIFPEDIILNLSKDAKIPELPDHLKTHKWGKIIHDRHAEWLASWKDTITGKTK